MLRTLSDSLFQSKLIDGFYVEAMALAEDARRYFDGVGRVERDGLNPIARVAFSCESLKVTTRLMHVIAWVLTQRAVETGEMDWVDARDPVRRLGRSPDSEELQIDGLPPHARALTRASLDLHRRVERIDQLADSAMPVASPVQMLHARLDQAF